jgi:hypothetical protein
MANGMFTGIIQTPEQVEAARRLRMFEEAKALGSLTPQQQASIIARQSGQNIGSLVGQLFGVEDPELKKARDLQEAAVSIKQSLPQDTQLDPATIYSEMSKAALNLGYTNEAMQFANEANKFSIQQNELRKVSGEQTTTKGVRVFRRGNGPLLVEENGQDVPYNEKKHGRFETAQDRTAPRGVTIKDITNRVGQVIGREFIDPITGDTIRKSYFEGMGPTDPGAGADGKKTMTNDEVRALVRGEQPTATDETRPVRSGRGRPVSNRVPTRPPEFILRGTNRIKNKAYDDWTAQYGATHNPDGTPK